MSTNTAYCLVAGEFKDRSAQMLQPFTRRPTPLQGPLCRSNLDLGELHPPDLPCFYQPRTLALSPACCQLLQRFQRLPRARPYLALISPASKKSWGTSGGLLRKSLIMLAERTGLEPATSGVTGRRSNQLNYRSVQWARTLWSDIATGNKNHRFRYWDMNSQRYP